MKFTVCKKVIESPIKNMYVLTVEFMHGDADHFDKLSFKFEHLPDLEFTYKAFEIVEKHQEDRDDDNACIEPLTEFIEPYINDGFDLANITVNVKHDTPISDYVDEFINTIPTDVTSAGDMRSYVRSMTVTYYDSDGHVHNVQVEKDKEQDL